MKEVVLRSKSPEDVRSHFISRLAERYEINISEQEYDSLCIPYGQFHGCFGKQRRKTIGWMTIKNVKVWVLRDGELGILATCYPPSVEHSNIEMIRSCFGGGMAKKAAIQIYRLYLKEAVKVSKMEFATIKDAALYFFNKTHFAPLHIDKFKHGSVKTHKVANVIRKIMVGESEHVTISLRKINR